MLTPPDAIKSMMEEVDITTLPSKKLISWQKQLKEVKVRYHHYDLDCR